jgi:hypothetical protein
MPPLRTLLTRAADELHDTPIAKSQTVRFIYKKIAQSMYSEDLKWVEYSGREVLLDVNEHVGSMISNG